MIYRTLSQVLIIVALALSSVAAWVWLFYGAGLATWLRREYVYAALASLVFIGIARSFTAAHRVTSIARASVRTGVTVLGCAGVVAIALLVAAWLGALWFENFLE